MGFFGKLCKGLLYLCLVVPACGTSPATPPASNDPASTKIASPLRHTIARLQQDGITAANAAQRQVETYATPLVRIDRHGRLHVVLVVSSVDDQVQLWLEAYQVDIEDTDATLLLVQAWVPFERLEEVARLAFVRYIRPPSYALRR